MLDATPELILPAMGSFYARLAPWMEAVLRASIGLALVPHGLRSCFGLFPTTGKIHDFTQMAAAIAEGGYRPGKFWAAIAALTIFIAGPLLALGLFTRPVALTVAVFMFLSAIDHARLGGYFCNRNGLEYPLLWAIGALFFAVKGGGAYSLDRMLLGWEF